jgi:hypothetical protein
MSCRSAGRGEVVGLDMEMRWMWRNSITIRIEDFAHSLLAQARGQLAHIGDAGHRTLNQHPKVNTRQRNSIQNILQ